MGGFAAGVGRLGDPSLPIGFDRCCRAKFLSPIPNNRHKSTKHAGSANGPFGIDDPTLDEADLGVPSERKPAITVSCYKNKNGSEKILSGVLFQSIEAL